MESQKTAGLIKLCAAGIKSASRNNDQRVVNNAEFMSSEPIVFSDNVRHATWYKQPLAHEGSHVLPFKHKKV